MTLGGRTGVSWWCAASHFWYLFPSLFLGILAKGVREPAWHRWARQRRAKARIILRALSRSQGISLNRKQLQSVLVLHGHHGSDPPTILMSWTCSWCQVTMPVSEMFCRGCHYRWEEVIAKAKRARSQSRSKQQDRTPSKGKEKGKSKQGGKMDKVAPTEPFPSGKGPASTPATGQPWQTSTPTRRLNLPTAMADMHPATPATGEAPASAQEEKSDKLDKLEKLYASLASAGSMTEDVQKAFNELKVDLTTPMVTPQLTHKHVNIIRKAEAKVETLSQKLKELDEKWQTFTDFMKQRWKEQAQNYQDHRQQVVSDLQEARDKLVKAKAEISSAAMAMEPPKEAIIEVEDMEVGLPTNWEDMDCSVEKRLAEGKASALQPFAKRPKGGEDPDL